MTTAHTALVTIMLTLAGSAHASDALSTHHLSVTYDERSLPLKVYLPKGNAPRPLILYSHGLGGSCETKQYLLEHWTQSGFICVSVQHPGSDITVIKDARGGNRLQALKKAAGAEAFFNRVKDIPAVLDQLEKWNMQEGHPLYKAIDFSRVGMSGHSFGAITSQALMGTDYAGKTFGDDRLHSFLLMSPSPGRSRNLEKSFGHISAPVFVMTGTDDRSVITPSIDGPAREKVYHALPKGDKYLYVFDGGTHNLFSGPTRLKKRLMPEHKIVQDLSLLFFQCHLQDDKTATKKLKSYKGRAADKWDRK